MLPRNNMGELIKILSYALLFTVCLFLSSPASADNVIIKFYQDHISAVDGDRCHMHPSCTVYANNAIKKHGFLIGWMMACDRLVRCGRDEKKISAAIVRDNQHYIYDTVDANDFWWFNKKK